jgi:hypothetical protein
MPAGVTINTCTMNIPSGMHMNQERPTRLERKLSKDLKKEVHREEVALHHHLKEMERAEHHRKEAERLREDLAKLRIKQLRLEEKIEEHEIKAKRLEQTPPELSRLL